VPLTPLHPNYWKVIMLNIALFLILTGGAALAIVLLDEESRPYLVHTVIGFAVFAILLFALFRLSFKRRGLAIREKDIIYSSGILSATTTIIPFHRIQHVALNEGVFSRMYHLGSLEVFTAGGQSGHIKIHGMEINEANKVKELLSKKLDHGKG